MTKRLTVLIADDELIARKGYRTVLDTVDGIEIVGEAITADEVVDMVLNLHPDVVLMDLKWGDDMGAGIAAIERIKRSIIQTKVVALTHYSGLIGPARQAGADAILRTGFTLEELLSVLRVPFGSMKPLDADKNRGSKPIQIITYDRAFLTQLCVNIEHSFNINEFKRLVFDLEIDYDNLSGDNKLTKVLSLVQLLNRSGCVAKLITYCQRERPKISWMEESMTYKIRVMFADDQLIVRLGLHAVLELEEDIEIVGEEAHSAQAVVERAKEIRPDVLLMDLKWYDDITAGASAIHQMKKDIPSTCIIAITAHAELSEGARRAGADMVLPKGFSKDELVDAIRTVYKLQGFPLLLDKPQLNDFPEQLSGRELQVLQLIASGLGDKEIASKLGITVPTAKNHASNIMGKFSAANRTQAVAIGYQYGLLNKNDAANES